MGVEMGIWERAVALNNERNLGGNKGNQKETTIVFAGNKGGREGVQGHHDLIPPVNVKIYIIEEINNIFK